MMGVGGADVDVDGVGMGVGGSVGEEEEVTSCRTASRKTSTILSIGSERKDSMAGSVCG